MIIIGLNVICFLSVTSYPDFTKNGHIHPNLLQSNRYINYKKRIEYIHLLFYKNFSLPICYKRLTYSYELKNASLDRCFISVEAINGILVVRPSLAACTFLNGNSNISLFHVFTASLYTVRAAVISLCK